MDEQEVRQVCSDRHETCTLIFQLFEIYNFVDYGVQSLPGSAASRKSRQYRPILPTRVWMRHFPRALYSDLYGIGRGPRYKIRISSSGRSRYSTPGTTVLVGNGSSGQLCGRGFRHVAGTSPALSRQVWTCGAGTPPSEYKALGLERGRESFVRESFVY